MTPLVADLAGVFLLSACLTVTHGSWRVLDQPLLYQIVSRLLKDVQRKTSVAALEKATFLFTVISKLGLFLEEESLNKPQILCDRNLRILHTFGNTL